MGINMTSSPYVSVPLVARRIWVVAVAIAVADLAVRPMDHNLGALIPSNVAGSIGGLSLRGMPGRIAAVALATDPPTAIVAPHYMLVRH
jgi:hypothetical protein